MELWKRKFVFYVLKEWSRLGCDFQLGLFIPVAA